MEGSSIALYGDTGSGKTTQLGVHAKALYKKKGKKTRLYAADMGGFGSIQPLVTVGVIDVVPLLPTDDPWIWINNSAEGKGLNGEELNPDEIGCLAYDSATSNGEALLTNCANAPFQIGSQKTQKFTVNRGANTLQVGMTNENHFGVVQGFMLNMIWKSTWLTKRGPDVIWTFSILRGEGPDQIPVLGPKLAGKALTAAIPKWFNYTFMLTSIPELDKAPRHVLYLQEQPNEFGSVSFGNLRFPLDAVTEAPISIEPADIEKALEAVGVANEEAESALREELGIY